MLKRPVLILMLLAAVTAFSPGARSADLFGRADQPRGENAAPPPAPALPAINLPAPLKSVLADALAVQSRLNAQLRAELQAARHGDSWRPALAIILVSFLYGIFHAVGPGHGKVVVGSYFLSRRARLLHGLGLSAFSALIQASSAILLVSLLAAILDVSNRAILDKAGTLETISYGLITALGLWMGFNLLGGRDSCGHDHEHEHGQAHAHEHEHEHHAVHAHRHDQTCDGTPPPTPPVGRRQELLRLMTAGLAVGVRPCSGAILVLLFTLANGIYPIGIIATFAMAFGVAITVAAVSLATLGLHRSLSALGPDHGALSLRLRQTAAFAGALVITLFGALQLLGVWSGAITPMAG